MKLILLEYDKINFKRKDGVVIVNSSKIQYHVGTVGVNMVLAYNNLGTTPQGHIDQYSVVSTSDNFNQNVIACESYPFTLIKINQRKLNEIRNIYLSSIIKIEPLNKGITDFGSIVVCSVYNWGATIDYDVYIVADGIDSIVSSCLFGDPNGFKNKVYPVSGMTSITISSNDIEQYGDKGVVQFYSVDDFDNIVKQECVITSLPDNSLLVEWDFLAQDGSYVVLT